MSNFTSVTPMKIWCQKILPLVYDNSLSYYEVLCKLTDTLNTLIENNNNIPQFIIDIIRDFLSSEEIEKIFNEIFSTFILNVKTPPDGIKPAVGNGTEDDTDSIQQTIDYASENGYGAVYFPPGKYLTRPLTLKSNVGVYGQDRYSTTLVLRGGSSNSIFNGTVENVTIANLGFDGNDGFQVNDVSCVSLNGTNLLLINLRFVDAVTHLVLNTSYGHVQMNDLIFKNSVIQHMEISGEAIIQANNLFFDSISANKGEQMISVNSNNGSYVFDSIANVPLAVMVYGEDNYFKGHVINAQKDFEDNGQGNSFEIIGKTTVVNHGGVWEDAANAITFNVLTKMLYNAEDIVLNPKNPLTYGSPEKGYIEITSSTDGNVYKIGAVNGLIPSSWFGIKGDKSDETDKLQHAINTAAQWSYGLLIEKGKNVGYSNKIELPSNFTLKLDGFLYILHPDYCYLTTISGSPQPEYSGKNDILICGDGGINCRSNDLIDGDIYPQYGETVTPFRFYHCANIVIKDINILDTGYFHAIELGAVNHAIIDNVKFLGQVVKGWSFDVNQDNYGQILIQIEKPSNESGSFGAIPYDSTPCKNITISNCLFAPNNGRKVNAAIGSHGDNVKNIFHENIYILNNTFLDIAFDCIEPLWWKNVIISGNSVDKSGAGFINQPVDDEYCIVCGVISDNNLVDISHSVDILNSPKFALRTSFSDTLNIYGNNISGCYTGILACKSSANIMFNGNNVSYALQLNDLKSTNNYSMFWLRQGTNFLFSNNYLAVQETDNISSKLLTDDVMPTNFRFFGNFIDMKKLSGQGINITANTTSLYSGEASCPGTYQLSEYPGRFDEIAVILEYKNILSKCAFTNRWLSNKIIDSVVFGGPTIFYVELTLDGDNIIFNMAHKYNWIQGDAQNPPHWELIENTEVILKGVYGIIPNNRRNINGFV